MRKPGYFVAILLVCFLVLSVCETMGDPIAVYAYNELRRAVLSQVNSKMEAEELGLKYAGEYDAVGLILLLGEFRDEEAQDILLSFLDVYLGSSSGEALTYAILKQGKTVQSKLRKVKEKDVGYMFRDEWKSIQEEFPNLRYMKVPDRNRNIDRLLDLIERGVTVKYEL